MYDDTVENLRELQLLTENCENQSSCLDCKNKDLCDKYDNKTLGATSCQAADAIEELQATVEGYESSTNMAFVEKDGETVIEFQPKWIPVTERLPELDKEVLVYAVCKIDGFIGSSVFALSERFLFKFFPSSKGTEEWRSPWQYFMTDYEITHWMPLPQPPKEVNTDGQQKRELL